MNRILALLLVLALTVPNPAYALRQTELSENKSGAEELTDILQAGLQQTSSRSAQSGAEEETWKFAVPGIRIEFSRKLLDRMEPELRDLLQQVVIPALFEMPEYVGYRAYPPAVRKLKDSSEKLLLDSTSKCNTRSFEDLRWGFESEAFPRSVIEPALHRLNLAL